MHKLNDQLARSGDAASEEEIKKAKDVVAQAKDVISPAKVADRN